MSIRNFGEALAKVRSLVGRVKSWLPLIDTQALKFAETAFNDKFPFAHKLRHSVAHPELYNDPTKKMGIDGDMEELGINVSNVRDMTIKGLISGNTFASTFEGILVRYDLTEDTICTILRIIHQVFDAFSIADIHGRRAFPPRQ